MPYQHINKSTYPLLSKSKYLINLAVYMKITNETKVGLLTIVALVILILGFNFLKGNNVLNRSKKLYAIFPDVGSLSKSNAVKIKGYEVGTVYSINATDKNL